MPAPPSGTAPRGRRHEGHGAQVFARDMRVPPDAPLFYLDRGQADGVRADVNAGHLVCPIGDCPDPRFTVRGGSKRDGFAHRAGVHGHGPETVAHHTSKQLVAAWLRVQHPDAHLDVDTREVENGQRPDVTLTLTDGTVVAYEVQFAALEQREWQHRHDGYRALGIRDVWLFGGKHYDRRPRRSSAEPDAVAVHPVFHSVLAAGHPMLLIDPWAETVALGAGRDVDALLRAHGVRPPPVRGEAIASGRIPLRDATTARGVIDLPGLREQVTKARQGHPRWLEHLKALEEEERRWSRRLRIQIEREERLRAAGAAARAENERKQEVLRRQREAEQTRVEERCRAELDQRQRAWAPARAAIEATRGPLPAVVDATPHKDELILITDAPDQWRWAILDALTRHAGHAVDPSDLHRFLTLNENVYPGSAWTLIWTYLRVLRRQGWVWWWGSTDTGTHEAVRMLADLEHPPTEIPVEGALKVKVVSQRSGRRPRYATTVNGPPPQGLGTPPGVYGLEWKYKRTRA